ncbi:MAG: bifunctional riboflavin kinase/FAD synthetase [Candidatus Omnitrophota bacterium]
MKVFYGLHALRRPFPRPVVTLGAFDGIHRAHQSLLRRIIQRSHRLGGTSILLTFHPHPVKVLKPRTSFTALTCLPHRLKLLDSLGLDVCVVIPFTKHLSRLSASSFIKKFLVEKLRIRELWVGFDYVFGKGRRGNFRLLKKQGRRYGFAVRRLAEMKYRGTLYSSTRIRTLVAKGNLAEATRFLGRPHSLYGTVVRGRGRGKRLGCPTANLRPCHDAIPPRGVYAVTAFLQGKKRARPYLGILNIGYRPTFEKRKAQVIEVHLLDYRGTLYGKKMEVSFLKRIRPEKKFKSAEALMTRIRCDERAARRLRNTPKLF